MPPKRKDTYRSNVLPSLLASLPLPPSIPSQYDAHLAPVKERNDVRLLASLVERGSAGAWLEGVMRESKAREDQRRRQFEAWRKRKLEKERRAKKRERDGRRRRGEQVTESEGENSEDEEADAEELREKGFVHKKKKRAKGKKRARDSDDEGGTTEGEIEREIAAAEGSKTEGNTTGGAESAGGKKKDKKKKKPRVIAGSLKIPGIKVERAELPQGFPSSDLFHSLHAHASSLMISQHALLPPLTLSSPKLPRHVKRHFSALRKSINEAELNVAKYGSLREVKEFGKTRLPGKMKGGRRAVWADADKAFESSALIAMGMLSQLLAEDAASPSFPCC
ncbi:hypothetical protein JCM8547_009161 [Rhodosporidiobolus lusitaniae]